MAKTRGKTGVIYPVQTEKKSNFFRRADGLQNDGDLNIMEV